MFLARLSCSIAVGASVLFPAFAFAEEPITDFDFWLGTWAVQNRHRTPNGLVESGTAEALIFPVLGGAAVYEQWDGREGRMSSMFGTSLRWEDPDSGRWLVMLNWPGGTPRAPRFGVMEGVWDDEGVCRQYSRGLLDQGDEALDQAQFYSFSDITPDACRWTMHNPGPQGGHFEAWIMDFARRAPGASSGSRLPVSGPPDQCACEAESARAMDGMIGVWTGTVGDAGSKAEARISSAARGCITAVSIWFEEDGEMRERWFALLSQPAGGAPWNARLLDADLQLHEMDGPVVRGLASFTSGEKALTLSIDGDRLEIAVNADGEEHAFLLKRD